MPKKAIIIGGGPAGLTAAYEFLEKTDIEPIIVERDAILGGISRTINHNGNRIDIGGHRFFSKSETVMSFWKKMLPVQGAPSKDEVLLQSDTTGQIVIGGPDPEQTDNVLLVRQRLSRIYYLKKFFSYPVTLSWNTITNLGPVRIAKIGWSYAVARIFPRTEVSLEDFFINRFGRELYGTFFKEYTEKVWGHPCSKIKAEWGAQRIKGLSITKAVLHALGSIFPKSTDIDQKKTETSLIEKFLYPKYGPGQMWENVAEHVQKRGGTVHMNRDVTALTLNAGKIMSITLRDTITGMEEELSGEYFFSTMPIKDLIARMHGDVPTSIREKANQLEYRDFMTIGLLLNKLTITNQTPRKTLNNLVPDNWIYIQEPGVKVGRLQIFNNWSPYMVKDINTVWVGMEYFVNEGDELWAMSDTDFRAFAIGELAAIGIIDAADVLDSTVIRIPKAYPAYTGEGYEHFSDIREFVDQIENLFLIGRNGMHRYNNQDHSMLTAMQAVENIKNNNSAKANIWNVNAEQEYHEEKKV